MTILFIKVGEKKLIWYSFIIFWQIFSLNKLGNLSVTIYDNVILMTALHLPTDEYVYVMS